MFEKPPLVRIPHGSIPRLVLVRIPFRGFDCHPTSHGAPRRNAMGSNPIARTHTHTPLLIPCPTRSRPVHGTSASVPQWQSSGLWNRPPGFDSRQRHLCFAFSQPATRPKDLLDLASQKRGTGGNRTPFSRTQAGNRTSRPQSHRWIYEPRQNGIRTRTNPVMLPCGIRTRGCFSTLTLQLVGVERTVRTNRCNW